MLGRHINITHRRTCSLVCQAQAGKVRAIVSLEELHASEGQEQHERQKAWVRKQLQVL
jgi:hypothetical protein